MIATGIVRRIDDLSRVVIPKEIRRTMRIREERLVDNIGAVGSVQLRNAGAGETRRVGQYIKQKAGAVRLASAFVHSLCSITHSNSSG